MEPKARETPPEFGSPSDPRGPGQPVLPREISEFLQDFSLAVHRFAMYPPGHVSLERAVESMLARLNGLFQERPQLSVGATPTRLVVDSLTTSERNPVLTDLAQRIHGHQIAAVVFHPGVTLDEVTGLLEALTRDATRGDGPIGFLPDEKRPRWESIRLHAVGYDQLELERVDPRKERAARLQTLWLGMVEASATEEERDSGSLPGPAGLAEVIARRGGDSGFEGLIAGHLHELAEELNGATGVVAREVRETLSTLISEMDPDTLARLLSHGGDRAARRRIVRNVGQGGLRVDAVLRVVVAAARVEGEEVSRPLTLFLAKLARQSEEGSPAIRAEADSAFREVVDTLIQRWDGGSRSPDLYTPVLDSIGRGSPLFEGPDEMAGADRLVRMALEVEAIGPTLERAVADLLDRDKMSRLLELLGTAPDGNPVAQLIERRLSTPALLNRMLAGDDLDPRALRWLVDRLGPDALIPLFDSLSSSESRAVRRHVFDCLADGGDAVARRALAELEDERWFVKRNALALLQKLDALPADFSPIDFLRHSDVRVRREAVALSLRSATFREEGLEIALADSDERVVRTALLDAQEGVPDFLVPGIVERIIESDDFPQLRSLAVRSLRRSRSPAAREALLDVCSGRKSFLLKKRLAPKSQELLAALPGLARNWGTHPEVRWVIEQARESPDPEIRAAVEPGGDPR